MPLSKKSTRTTKKSKSKVVPVNVNKAKTKKRTAGKNKKTAARLAKTAKTESIKPNKIVKVKQGTPTRKVKEGADKKTKTNLVLEAIKQGETDTSAGFLQKSKQATQEKEFEIIAEEELDINKKQAEQEVDQELVDDKDQTKQGRSLTLYRKIALSFIILTLALLLVIFYFSFVKVSIVLIPNQEHLSSNLIIDVFNKDKRSVVSDGNIMGVVKQVEVEQTKTYYSSGIEVIGEEVVGEVVIINNYIRSQQLVATTRLLSPDNKLFRLKNTVIVPAGGQIIVEVYADEPGPNMAIGPTHFTIPGLWAGLQDKIYGESREAMKYSKKVKKHIQQIDIDNGVKDLKQSLLTKAENEIGEIYQSYDQVIYDIDNNSISRQVEGKVGEEKDEFSITMRTNVTVVAFDEDEIYKLVKQKLISVLPDDKELIDFSKDNISYNLNNYNINQGVASLNIAFFGKMIIKDGNNIVDREKILGLNKQQLNDYLNSLPNITVHEIKFYPSFIKKVPNLIDRIEIKIKR